MVLDLAGELLADIGTAFRTTFKFDADANPLQSNNNNRSMTSSSGHQKSPQNDNKPSKYSGIASHRTTFGTVFGTALSGLGLK